MPRFGTYKPPVPGKKKVQPYVTPPKLRAPKVASR